ncbi:MAG: putative 4-mercaptohistidine N1-methyltransferase [Verrucomicrobiota bacterium]
MNPYETRKLVDEYLLFHYGEGQDVLPWEKGPKEALDFAVRSVEETVEWDEVPKEARALDVGCAVGRSSFELARHCEEVIGIDFSAAFVDAAKENAQKGLATFQVLEEGHVSRTREAKLPKGISPERVQFEVGDAMDLRPELGAFDVVHGANLVCRLKYPRLFLDRLEQLVKPGGQLALTTPCTWLEEFTPRENWPEEDTLSFLREHLEPKFVLLKLVDLPFLIRETARKYQWTVALGSVWRRIR